MYDAVKHLDTMRRRTVVRRAGIGLTALAVPGVSGCLSGDDGTDTQTQSLPELDVSNRSIDSSVAELSIVDHEVELLRGQQHDDIHFGVTPTVENTSDQQADLDAYQYDIALYSPEDIDITPGRTWTANAEQVPAGETGTVLLQVSFLDAEGVDPEDVDQYEVALSCDGNGAYC